MMIEYIIIAFICGFGCGLVGVYNTMRGARDEIKRLNKSWRTAYENKEERINALEKEIERLKGLI